MDTLAHIPDASINPADVGFQHAARKAADDVARAGGRIVSDAIRPGGYPIKLPGGGHVRVDLRKCAAAAARGPYAGHSIHPHTPTQACAVAARFLLAAASPVPPQDAVAALTQTAGAGGLDVQAALDELDSKETR